MQSYLFSSMFFSQRNFVEINMMIFVKKAKITKFLPNVTRTFNAISLHVSLAWWNKRKTV